MEDKYRSFNSEKHISLNEAYERILHELSTMDDRFYDYIDQQNLQRSITNEDKLTFVIPGKLIFQVEKSIVHFSLFRTDEHAPCDIQDTKLCCNHQ